MGSPYQNQCKRCRKYFVVINDYYELCEKCREEDYERDNLDVDSGDKDSD